MQTIRYALQDGIATVTFDEPNSPVNTRCLQWQQDMDALAAQVLQDKDSIQGIIPRDASKPLFSALATHRVSETPHFAEFCASALA